MSTGFIKRVVDFYVDGFRNLSPHSRTLWIIIMVKLFFMFFILKLFFFRDTIKNKFETDEERSEYIIDQITNSNK